MWITLFGVLITWSVFMYLNFRKKYDFARTVPILESSYPLIGCGHLFLGKSALQKFQNLCKLFTSDRKLYRFWMGPKMIFGTTDPNVAHSILSNPMWLDKPFIYDFFKLDHGLFAAKINLWKEQRKALNPTFNIKILQSFIPIFIEYSRNMVDRLVAIPEGTTVNVMEHAIKCSMEMIVATTIGYDINVFKEVDIFGEKVERFFYLASIRILNVLHYSDALYRWTKLYREEKALREYLNDIVMKIVKDKELQYDETAQKLAANQPEKEFKTPQIFIHELFANKVKKFSDREIFENVFTIIGAGTDTSSTTIAYCCVALGLNPDVQQKLYDEVMRIYSEENPEFTLDSLKQLQYTEMVLKETLRLYPVAPILIRQSAGESTVEGMRIPKGNLFAIHVFNMHRRVDLWGADVDQFVPERFSPERAQEFNPLAFLAFSAGSRNCIGVRYAMISMKIMLVHLIKTFRIKTELREEDLRFRFEGILRLENGHLIQLERR